MKWSAWVFSAVLAAFSLSAHAHTRLLQSVPADQAVLASAPAEIVLEFSEPTRLTALSIRQAGAAQRDLAPLPAGPSARFVASATDLPVGNHVLTWRAVSEDMHVVSGTIRFRISGF